MAEVYFLGDTHFGHRNILKYRPQFKTIKEHDDYIIDRINSVVTKRDKLILTGDICFDRGALDCLRRIKCPCIHLLLGNHDDYNIDFKKEVNGVQWVSGDFKYKEFWISHIPLHPDNLRGRVNIHAHLHEGKMKDKYNYVHTSCEQLDYTPISLQQIRAKQDSLMPKAKRKLLKLLKEGLPSASKTVTKIPSSFGNHKTKPKKRRT